MYNLHFLSVLVCGLLLALLGGLLLGSDQTPRPAVTDQPPATSLERQIGQLIMVGFAGSATTDTGVQAVAAQLASGRIGGVMLLGRNIRTQGQLARLTRHLAAQTPEVPALVAVDQEGGQVQRLVPLGSAFAWMAAQDLPSATGNCAPEAVQAYYGSRAAQLAALGINLNFGPVVDLNLRPQNPAIGRLKRSFSADPRLVTACADGFLAAHTAAGIATALKHFPGHGSADADSHHRLPVIDARWQDSELQPYLALAKLDRVDMVMMGHLVHRRFSDRPDLPASLSRKGVLEARALVGPRTVLITDDLEKALAEADVLIDFTFPDVTLKNLEVCARLGRKMVIGSTGFTPEQRKQVEQHAAEIPVVLAPNMSVGVNACFKLLKEAASILGDGFEVEIVELHHNKKKDAPSGTAVRMGEVVAESLGRDYNECAVFHREGMTGERTHDEIGMQTVRGGDIVGEHTVYFIGLGERIEITHRAMSRDMFARGSARAAQWLDDKGPGLYDMQDVLGLK